MLHDHQATSTPCPCGSGKNYNQCCEPAIEGIKPASTAELLMRSRYTAFAIGRSDYLLKTTHPDHRQELSIELLDEQISMTTWSELEILETIQGSESDSTGVVSFIASFSSDEGEAQLHETSRFIRENEHWLYVDGEIKLVQ
ncbi:MAG: YchJ family protein [Motiliproteus sp.]|nr:YchJ family protein [Motiliproteus sp.]MCW9051045.1 YchJ family protein [Motiliproteus sp.]